MSTKRIQYPALFLLLLFILLTAGGCNKTRKNILEKMKELQRGEYKGKELSAQTIEELKEGIAAYEKEAERTIEATEQLGIYYKLLAVQYLDREMYGPAMESIENALFYYPENPILYHLGGVCSARMAKVDIQGNNRSELLNKAEKYYLRAIELDSGYVDSLYGLSVLYIFELDKPFDAEPLLKRILSREKRNSDAMFLLARVYVLSGRIEDAVALYETIEETAPDPVKKAQAAENRRLLMENAYE